MKAYMKQSPKVYFEFSVLVFVLNVLIATVLGLLLSLVGWVAGLVTGIVTFIVLYGLEGNSSTIRLLRITLKSGYFMLKQNLAEFMN